MGAKRISPRQWDEIKEFYDKCVDSGDKNPQATTRKKFDLKPGTLGDKIKRDGWRLSEDQKDALKGFSEASAKVSESFRTANESQKKHMIDELETALEDMELIENNRKLLKGFQAQIAKSIKSGDYRTPQDIKAGTAAIKDIESIANPRPTQQINVNQQQAQQQETKRVTIARRSDIIK